MSLSVQDLAKANFPFVIVAHPDGKLSIGRPPGEELKLAMENGVYQAGHNHLLSTFESSVGMARGQSRTFTPSETDRQEESTDSVWLLNRQKMLFFLTWIGSILITLITAILFFLSRGRSELHGAFAFFLGKYRHRTHIALVFGSLIDQFVAFVTAYYEMNRALSLALVADVFIIVLSTTIMTPIFIAAQVVAFLAGIELNYSISRVHSLQPPASLFLNLARFSYRCIVRMACCCRQADGQGRRSRQDSDTGERQHAGVWIAEVGLEPNSNQSTHV